MFANVKGQGHLIYLTNENSNNSSNSCSRGAIQVHLKENKLVCVVFIDNGSIKNKNINENGQMGRTSQKSVKMLMTSFLVKIYDYFNIFFVNIFDILFI